MISENASNEVNVSKGEQRMPVRPISTVPLQATPTKGLISYDTITNQPYYANGVQWLPMSGSSGVTNITVGTGLQGTPNPITGTGTIIMADTTVVPGVYGNANNVAQFTVDQQGRLTTATNVPVASTVNITAGVGLNSTPAPITGTGTVNLADTAVVPGVYGNATNVPQFTVDQQGRLTAAGNVAITSPANSLALNVTAPNQGVAVTTTTLITVGTARVPNSGPQDFTFAAGVGTCTNTGYYEIQANIYGDTGEISATNYLFQVTIDINDGDDQYIHPTYFNSQQAGSSLFVATARELVNLAPGNEVRIYFRHAGPTGNIFVNCNLWATRTQIVP